MENQQWYVPKDAKFGDEIAPNVKYIGVQQEFTMLYDTEKGKILYTVSPEIHKRNVNALNEFRNRPWWKKLLDID